MVSFSQLPAVKKDTIFVAARKIFGPSYFVMALTWFQKIQVGQLDSFRINLESFKTFRGLKSVPGQVLFLDSQYNKVALEKFGNTANVNCILLGTH